MTKNYKFVQMRFHFLQFILKKKNHTDDVDVKKLTNMTQLNLNTGHYVVLGCYKGKEVI